MDGPSFQLQRASDMYRQAASSPFVRATSAAARNPWNQPNAGSSPMTPMAMAVAPTSSWVGGQGQLGAGAGGGGQFRRPAAPRPDPRRPNHILLFRILDPRHPVTTAVIHRICRGLAEVVRIVILRKREVPLSISIT